MSVHATTGFMPPRPAFVDIRCPSCAKLLFRVRRDSRRAIVDAKCPRCSHLSLLSIGTTAA